jgi:hypothetical protein
VVIGIDPELTAIPEDPIYLANLRIKRMLFLEMTMMTVLNQI